MEAINAIRDERLALADNFQERREQLLDVLKTIPSITLEDLHTVLQQYCSIRRDVIFMIDSLDVMEEELREVSNYF